MWLCELCYVWARWTHDVIVMTSWVILVWLRSEICHGTPALHNVGCNVGNFRILELWPFTHLKEKHAELYKTTKRKTIYRLVQNVCNISTYSGCFCASNFGPIDNSKRSTDQVISLSLCSALSLWECLTEGGASFIYTSRTKACFTTRPAECAFKVRTSLFFQCISPMTSMSHHILLNPA